MVLVILSVLSYYTGRKIISEQIDREISYKINELKLSVNNKIISHSRIAEILARTVEVSGNTMSQDEYKNLVQKYDFIFIDCPPSLGLLTINALTASHSVIIPIQCEFYALEGVGQLINTIQLVRESLNRSLEIEGVIMSMCDMRTNLSTQVISEVKKFFKDKVYKTTIPRNIRLAEAPSFGLPVVLYDDKCKGAEAYELLTKEFLNRQKE
jgi:chromosome partitioning protein